MKPTFTPLPPHDVFFVNPRRFIPSGAVGSTRHAGTLQGHQVPFRSLDRSRGRPFAAPRHKGVVGRTCFTGNTQVEWSKLPMVSRCRFSPAKPIVPWASDGFPSVFKWLSSQIHRCRGHPHVWIGILQPNIQVDYQLVGAKKVRMSWCRAWLLWHLP